MDILTELWFRFVGLLNGSALFQAVLYTAMVSAPFLFLLWFCGNLAGWRPESHFWRRINNFFFGVVIFAFIFGSFLGGYEFFKDFLF